MKSNGLIGSSKWLLIGLFAVGVSGVIVSGGKLQAKDDEKKEHIGYTLPAELKPVELRFKSSGIVKSLSIKEGDVVNEGQLLMILDG